MKSNIFKYDQNGRNNKDTHCINLDCKNYINYKIYIHTNNKDVHTKF